MKVVTSREVKTLKVVKKLSLKSTAVADPRTTHVSVGLHGSDPRCSWFLYLMGLGTCMSREG